MSSKRIHILGLGNLGRLFAHALANKHPPPPITLLFHRPTLLQEWTLAGQKIQITTHGVTNSHGTFEIEEVPPHHTNPNQKHNQEQKQHDEIIENLIVTTKTIHTVKAIDAIKTRLGRNSTILFAQNGMGTIEEVTESLFPDETRRPNFLAAITSHGVYSQGPFRSVHAGLANTTVGQVHPRGDQNSQYLLSQIVNSPILAATEVSPSEILKAQLEKLVVNAMINPLTVVFGCKNGELFSRPEILDVMRNMLGEVYEVLQTLSSGPQHDERFLLEKLEEKVVSVGVKTAENTSSMRQDVQAGRETEIEYINGWIVRKARENGVTCVWNEKVIEMVKKGDAIAVADIREHFPLEGGEVSSMSRLTSKNFLELQEANKASVN